MIPVPDSLGKEYCGILVALDESLHVQCWRRACFPRLGGAFPCYGKLLEKVPIVQTTIKSTGFNK
jgi:hypothetical protein